MIDRHVIDEDRRAGMAFDETSEFARPWIEERRCYVQALREREDAVERAVVDPRLFGRAENREAQAGESGVSCERQQFVVVSFDAWVEAREDGGDAFVARAFERVTIVVPHQTRRDIDDPVDTGLGRVAQQIFEQIRWAEIGTGRVPRTLGGVRLPIVDVRIDDHRRWPLRAAETVTNL